MPDELPPVGACAPLDWTALWTHESDWEKLVRSCVAETAPEKWGQPVASKLGYADGGFIQWDAFADGQMFVRDVPLNEEKVAGACGTYIAAKMAEWGVEQVGALSPSQFSEICETLGKVNDEVWRRKFAYGVMPRDGIKSYGERYEGRGLQGFARNSFDNL